MSKLTVGFVGWRGMVGSVLLQRMMENGQFHHIQCVFFSTSHAGGGAPSVPDGDPVVADANAVETLRKMDVILTCQGSDWTNVMFPLLRAGGWRGYWIDAASALRLQDDAVIVLDPVNRAVIERGLSGSVLTYVGGNCTVSLMMLALHGLMKEGLVEWISSMTYQAASGAGAASMRSLLLQMEELSQAAQPLLSDPASAILDIDQRVCACLRAQIHSDGVPLAGSLVPWIDQDLGGGLSREEWKAEMECNKILTGGHRKDGQLVKVDGLCVRIGAMRSHCQGLTLKLRGNPPLSEVEHLIASGHRWVKWVPNRKEESVKQLSPAAVSGTLDIAVGRVRQLSFGPGFYSAFTVGDQLLWGAAEPLWRTLEMIVQHASNA